MRKKVILACEVCQSRNYSTYKKSDQSDRLEIKKYCGVCNTHSIHRETK